MENQMKKVTDSIIAILHISGLWLIISHGNYFYVV